MEHCPQCGVELDPGSPEGLCAACLFAGGFSVSESTETKLTMGTGRIAGSDPRAALEYDSFGYYHILRVLGEGGMGTVYLAEQTHPIQRRVALKVIKPGMDTREILSRFAYERQALALMDHPNIARVYDASATEKGRPYFVMEYIDGAPITQYCDARRLNTRERLELFGPVCQALQHAHSKGVIHRDIKPSNVLVVEQDGHAVPKVIDFGIAKATDQRAAENAAFTKLGQFVGTPEYMSPEQAELVSNDIDTSSDVYSLGVLLYELLVGAVPFDGVALRQAGMAELLRIIREDEAPALPSKLTGLGKTITQVAEQRSTDPGSLKRQVAGDLNWIVMKSLEKERHRRYLSVADLAADVQRHLDDQPVLASPPSVVYRTRKFVRRNRVAVAAGAAVAMALVAGVVGIAWQGRIAELRRREAVTQRNRAEANAREAQTQRQEAEAQRNQADAERRRAGDLFGGARQFANSMMLDVYDQIAQLDGATTARESLVNKSVAYLDRLEKDPSSDAQARRELAAAYIKVGDLQGRPEYANLNDKEGALASEQKAVAILEPLAQASPRDAELRHLLIVALARRGALQEFLPGGQNAMHADLQRSMALAERFASDEPANWQAKRDLALALDLNGNHARALQIMESVVTGPNTAQDRFEKAFYEWRLGQDILANHENALEQFGKSVAGLESLNREFPANAQYRRQLAVSLSAQSSLLQQMNRGTDAIASARSALAIQEQLAASDPKNTAFRLDVTGIQQTLGGMLAEAGKREEAMDMYRRALAVADKLVAEQAGNPDFHYQRAKCNQSIGAKLMPSKESIPYFRNAETELSELRRQFPDRTVYWRELVTTRAFLGLAVFGTLDRPGGFAIAAAAVAEGNALVAAIGASDDDRDASATAHLILSTLFFSAGRFREGLPEVRKAIAIEEPLVARHPENRGYLTTYGIMCANATSFYDIFDDYPSVIEYGSKALRYLDMQKIVTTGDNNQILVVTLALSSIGKAYARQGDHLDAVEANLRDVEIQEKFAGLDPSDALRASSSVTALLSLATEQRHAGDRQGALASYLRARATLDRFDPAKIAVLSQRLALADSYRRLSADLASMDEDSEALATARIAVQLFDALSQDDPRSALNVNGRQAHRALAAALDRSGDIQGAMEGYRSALDVEMKAVASTTGAGAPNYAADITRRIAHLEARTGDRTSAERDFRKAIELHLQAFARSDKNWNVDRKNLLPLRNNVFAERKIAEIMELLGQPAEALPYWSKAFEYAKNLVAADPRSDNIGTLNVPAEALMRLKWEKSGEQGDYLRIVGPDYQMPTATGYTSVPRTPANIRADVASSYSTAALVSYDDGDAERTRRAAAKAVEMYEALLRESPKDEANSTCNLALSLDRLSSSNFLLARRTSGEERRRNLQQAREYLTRAETLAKDAEAKHQLSLDNANLPGEIAVDLATVEAWLHDSAPVTAGH